MLIKFVSWLLKVRFNTLDILLLSVAVMLLTNMGISISKRHHYTDDITVVDGIVYHRISKDDDTFLVIEQNDSVQIDFRKRAKRTY